MKSILDPYFDYAPSVETNIRATFERAWRELDIRNRNGELVDSCSVKVLRDRKSSFHPSATKRSCSSAHTGSNATNHFSFAARS